ncbi:MAG: OPT/YSL family transporter, partial [Sphaerochaeta sp.]
MNRHLTVRGTLIGIAGLLVITASSMYVALRMGALPWPTIFVTVVSMAALRKAKGSTLQEINVTHTIMSSGAMVAGGLAFTLPGLWMLDPTANFSIPSLLVLTVVGAILGTLFSSLFRKKLIEEEALPYPMGIASYNTLQAGTKGGKGAKTLFASMGGSVIFTVLRDGFGKIPALLTLYGGSAVVPSFSIWVSPMAMGIGAIIGPLFALLWFGGAIFGYYILTPIGISQGL